MRKNSSIYDSCKILIIICSMIGMLYLAGCSDDDNDASPPSPSSVIDGAWKINLADDNTKETGMGTLLLAGNESYVAAIIELPKGILLFDGETTGSSISLSTINIKGTTFDGSIKNGAFEGYYSSEANGEGTWTAERISETTKFKVDGKWNVNLYNNQQQTNEEPYIMTLTENNGLLNGVVSGDDENGKPITINITGSISKNICILTWINSKGNNIALFADVIAAKNEISGSTYSLRDRQGGERFIAQKQK